MQTTKYVIKYKLNGERRFEFAQLQSGSEEEARAALEKIHGDADDVITEIKASGGEEQLKELDEAYKKGVDSL